MTPLRQHMMAALQRRGKGERTQEASVRAVRLLAQFSHKAPDRLSEQELQRSFLHRTNIDGLAPASMRLCSSGLRSRGIKGPTRRLTGPGRSARRCQKRLMMLNNNKGSQSQISGSALKTVGPLGSALRKNAGSTASAMMAGASQSQALTPDPSLCVRERGGAGPAARVPSLAS